MSLHTPVVPTQAVYRQLLQAMSRPGRAFALPAEKWASPLLAVCETLLDHEVSYCLLPGTDPEWDKEIFGATKARRAPAETADYAIVRGSDSAGAAGRLKVGVPEFPDQGATAIYVVTAPLEAEPPLLSGPGVKGEAKPEVNPLTAAEWELLRGLNAEYPLGVDAICLIGRDQVLCLPRSTRIRMV